MKGKRLLITIVCFVIIGILLTGFGLGCKSQTTATETKTLQIGSILALTGWFAGNEVTGARELDCMVDIINENGGIKVGDTYYKIEIVQMDNQSNLDGTAAAANQLAYDKKIKFVVETLGFLSLSGNSIFEENKILHVCPYNTFIPDEFNAQTPYKFVAGPSLFGSLSGTFSGIRQNFPDVINIACINPDDGTIPTTKPLLEKIVPGVGINLIGDIILYAPDTIDFNPIVSKLRSVQDVDAYVMIGGTNQQFAAVIKALRSMGDQKPFIWAGNISGPELMDIVGKEFAHNIMTLGMIEDAGNPPILNQLFEKMSTKYNDVAKYGINANCLYFITQGIEAAQSLDTTVVRDKLESMASFDTVFGEGTLGGLETYGIKHALVAPLPTHLIMNGEYTQGPWVSYSIP
ncbi:MAG: ABC transporter substrate-binding protein [Dehalococcoidales bacterium]|nr:ABC transporter substrate-binding protein [Dehalococcoidales bacterium]